MSQGTRIYTGDVSVFAVGGISFLQLFKDCTITCSLTTQDSRAAKDDWEWPVGRISKWTVTFPKVVDEEGTAANIWTAFNSTVTVAITTAPSLQKGIAYAGNALVTEIVRGLPDSDGQTDNVSLVGQGALTTTTIT